MRAGRYNAAKTTRLDSALNIGFGLSTTFIVAGKTRPVVSSIASTMTVPPIRSACISGA